jgi:hypothetical protein
MTPRDISEAKDPDLRSALTALQRASAMARKVAIDTGTELVIVSDGRLMLVDPRDLSQVALVEKPPAP